MFAKNGHVLQNWLLMFYLKTEKYWILGNATMLWIVVNNIRKNI